MMQFLTRTITLSFTVMFVCILFLPTIQRQFGVFKDKKLIDVPLPKQLPIFKTQSFLDGLFQRQFETWFMKTSGLWSYLLMTHNQISYQFFKQISSTYGDNNNFIVGKKHELFQTLYLRDYNADVKFHRRQIRHLAHKIKVLQDFMQAHGKALVVLVSANKLILYPEQVPKRFKKPKRMQNHRAITSFANQAHKLGLNWIQAHNILKDSKQVDFPFFAKSAAHWNSPAACIVARQLMLKIDALLPQNVNTIDCSSDYMVHQTPQGADRDLVEALNIWNPAPSFAPTPYTTATLKTHNNARPLDMLFIGTSFLWSIFDILEPVKTYNSRDFYYYGNTNHQAKILPNGQIEKNITRVNYKTLDWDKDIFNKDVIVLEINEARLPDLGFVFLKHAMTKLSYNEHQLSKSTKNN